MDAQTCITGFRWHCGKLKWADLCLTFKFWNYNEYFFFLFFFFQWFQSGFIQKRYKRGWYPKQVYVTLNIKMYVFYQCVYIWVLTPQSVNFEANHINNALRVLKYLLTVSQRSPCPSYSTLPHSLKTLLWGTIDLVQHTVVSMKNCLKWREAAISWPWEMKWKPD